MELNKVTLQYIIDSMMKCQGIKFILMAHSYRKAEKVYDRLETYFSAVRAKIVNSRRHGDQADMELMNGSRVTAVPYCEHALCGRRGHQVILIDELASDEKFIQHVARPLISWAGP